MKNKQSFKHYCATIIFCILFLSCNDLNLSDSKPNTGIDSIPIWIKYSKNKSLALKKRAYFLEEALNHTRVLENDTIKAKYLSTIAYRYFAIKDSTKFKKINTEALKIALRINDSFTIGDIHWSYADFYNVRENYTQSYYYFNESYKYFKNSYEIEAARMLMYMATIKGRYRDYTGSEVLLIQAIKTFKKLSLNRFLYEAYNELGLIQNDIKEYDRALSYHHQALTYIEKLNNKQILYAKSFNNIGLSYLEKGDHLKAIGYFNKALNNKIDIGRYARLIDNRAFGRLSLGDTSNVEKDMIRALHIRDSLDNKAGVSYNKIRLSKYYLFIKDTIKAHKYAYEANILSKKIKNSVDYLESLVLLSKLDKNNTEKYLNRHISYSDSLNNAERKTLDKFTRIEFETDEILEDNRLLSQQQIWISVIGGGLILILSLLYFLRVQRVKNEKLVLETEQQKANEQVYLLTLKQQATLEEERTRERNRISQELHDGILGRLFGTRVGMGFLDLKADEETKKQHQSFLKELQDIEKEIRDVSHKLNTNFESSEVNFTNIINQLLEAKSKVGNFQFQLNIDKNISWKSTDEIIKVNAYRIIQEALQNTIKHAHAKHVSLEFSSDKESLNILIKDDGAGFDPKKSKKGIGLKNIRSRVQKMKGTLNIQSAMNKGTLIHIKIPISST